MTMLHKSTKGPKSHSPLSLYPKAGGSMPWVIRYPEGLSLIDGIQTIIVAIFQQVYLLDGRWSSRIHSRKKGRCCPRAVSWYRIENVRAVMGHSGVLLELRQRTRKSIRSFQYAPIVSSQAFRRWCRVAVEDGGEARKKKTSWVPLDYIIFCVSLRHHLSPVR